MKEKNNLKKSWIKCSVICFVIAFCISMFILEEEQIRLIKGNSYYLSSVSIFLKTIFWPVHTCVLYSIITEIICQIMFWISMFLIPKEKRERKNIGCIIFPIISNIISFIIAVIVIISNFNFEF